MPTSAPHPRYLPDARPRSPMFTAAVDRARGVVTVRGHLDRVAADALADRLVHVRELGHRHVTVRIRPLATVDDDAARLLADLVQRLWANGVRLTVQ